MSEWIELEKQKPTAIGLYWVYYNHWRDGMTVGCIELQPIEVEPYISVYCAEVGGYDYEYHVTPENITHWIGPIQEPAPPAEVNHEHNN